jgi:hypothetical protein
MAAHHDLGYRWGVCPDASGAGQGTGGWSPAHTGQAGRVAGEWKEAKGFRFSLVDNERIVHLLSWYQVGQDEDVGATLRQVKDAGLIPEGQVRLCVIGDGAKWTWNQINALFSSAVQILDYYHCSEHVYTVGGRQFGEDAVQEREWVEAMMARLVWGYMV